MKREILTRYGIKRKFHREIPNGNKKFYEYIGNLWSNYCADDETTLLYLQEKTEKYTDEQRNNW